jgi:hypothetical protein
MSEPIPAEIRIGGRIPAKLVPTLCVAIAQEAIALEWGDAPFQPNTAADLLANRSDQDGSKILRLCDAQAHYGRFDQLERFLQQHGIAFDRFSDGKNEFDPEWVAFRPGGVPALIKTDASRQPTLAAIVLGDVLEQVNATIKKLMRGETPQALAALSVLQNNLAAEIPKIPRPLPLLEIETEPLLG